MGGGLMQLVAYGAQDAFLTGNPEITFFKVVYRRHTNFAMESIRQNFNGSSTWGSRATATISRNGDLISRCYIEAKLPYSTEDNTSTPGKKILNFCNSIGHKLIKDVELEIGGQLIDKHYSEWLEIWSELTLPAEKDSGYEQMVGKSDFRDERSVPTSGDTLFVPLQFFFCRNPGLALPLIAMQYHEVKLTFNFGSKSECILSGTQVDVESDVNNADKISPELWVDYVYLDTDERRRFAQVQHNMLIDQLQYNGGSVNNTMDLSFNHPCKELIWIKQDITAKGFNFDCGSSNYQGGPISSAVLKLNGHDRFEKRNGAYFHLVQPFQHHTRCPKQYIYSYSFSLNPEEHQPSGSCNFSRIDNARLILEDNLTDSTGCINKVYAVNYNILRIMSGMAGLAFSN